MDQTEACSKYSYGNDCMLWLCVCDSHPDSSLVGIMSFVMASLFDVIFYLFVSRFYSLVELTMGASFSTSKLHSLQSKHLQLLLLIWYSTFPKLTFVQSVVPLSPRFTFYLYAAYALTTRTFYFYFLHRLFLQISFTCEYTSCHYCAVSKYDRQQ